MIIRDVAAATSREVTPEGFLHVRARIARSGLHDYRGDEIGAPAPFGPGDRVRVYRPPDEVFSPESMASFGSKPVTDGHPPAMVDATNWKRYAVGQSGPVVTREGDHLAADLMIGDAAGAERALAGAELSNGYFADFVFEPGTTPEGEAYDAVQRNIRGNHLALVDAGRCGASCRIGDAAVLDCSCEGSGEPRLADEADHLRQRIVSLEATHRQALEAKDGALAALAAKIPDAAALDALVAERAGVIETARRVLGPAFDPAGHAVGDIRRCVVAAVLGADGLRERGGIYVTAAFDTLRAARATANPLAHAVSIGLRDAAGTRDAALNARNHHLAGAWKGDLDQGAS